MTAVKGFGRKWIAVNQLDSFVFGVTQHQTVEQSKMTPAGLVGSVLARMIDDEILARPVKETGLLLLGSAHPVPRE